MKPQLVIINEFPNWCFEIITNNLKHHLSDTFNIIVLGKGKHSGNINADIIMQMHMFGRSPTFPSNESVTRIVCVHSFGDLQKAEYFSQVSPMSIQLLSKFSRVLSVNPDIATLLSKTGIKCDYTPNGVDTKLFYPAAQNHTKFRVGWVGNPGDPNNMGLRSKVKGYYKYVLPTMQEIVAANSNIEFIPMLKTPESKRLPGVSHQSMPDYYNSIDLLVGMSSHEACQGVVLEALACGVAVVSTEVGIVSEINNQSPGCIQTIARTQEDLKKAVLEAAIDIPKTRLRGDQGRKVIETHWTWPFVVNSFWKPAILKAIKMA